MIWIKKLYTVFFITSATVVLFLVVDFLVGGYFISCENRTNVTIAHCHNKARVAHPIYHHDLQKNFSGMQAWGPLKYSLCTDVNGFKVDCNANEKSLKNFDIAFIGDSFTEGIGLEYKDTFVGQISAKLIGLKIANLGVSSYSPSIYLSKVKFLLEQGVTFKELVVYIDISDIQDEAVSYALVDGVVMNKTHGNSSVSIAFNQIKQLVRQAFPLTSYGAGILSIYFSNQGKNGKNKITYLMPQYERSAWTYNSSVQGYGSGGVNEGVQQSLKAMQELSDLLRNKGIGLSIGVYPWPAQLLYDKSDSEHVRIWRDFCKSRCVGFYDSFDDFFDLKSKMSVAELIENHFIEDDMHYNRMGAGILANDFLKSFKN